MKEPKFLYHGSSVKVDILKPFQATDWKCNHGCHFGVYATPDINVALGFALGAIPDEFGATSRLIKSKERQPFKMLFVKGKPNLGGKGYLYKLAYKGFRFIEDDQWVCGSSVEPLEIMEIDVDEYVHLFRYATIQEIEEIEKQIFEKKRYLRSRFKLCAMEEKNNL